MIPRLDVAVVGGGVVGLACARAFAQAGRTVALIERHARVATETSARNSGVLHAGLYYPAGSLKAVDCVRGRALVVEYCRRTGVPFAITGKWVLASDEAEAPALEHLARGAVANGARVELVSGAELTRQEPALVAHAALLSHDSGLVDAAELAGALLRELRALDVAVLLGTELVEVDRAGTSTVLTLQRADVTERLQATTVVTAAGLAGARVRALFGHTASDEPRIVPCKGDYFRLGAGAPRPNRPLVYPLPTAHGLGVHLTADLAGSVRAGPDTEFVPSATYDVDPGKRVAFARAVARYLPGVTPEHLEPDFAGVRPKLRADGVFADFLVEDEARHGMPGVVHLLGIESPGLTACLALAERVARGVGAVP